RCDVGKRAVAIVAVKCRLRRLLGMKQRRESAVYEERVHVAVLVVVDPGDAGAHRFGVHAFGRLRALMMKMDTRLGGDIAELDAAGVREVRAVAKRFALVGLRLLLLVLLQLSQLAQSAAEQAGGEVGCGS